jgi:hypothetical protein
MIHKREQYILKLYNQQADYLMLNDDNAISSVYFL